MLKTCYNPIMGGNNNITDDMTTFYILDNTGHIANIACLDAESLDRYKTDNAYVFFRCRDEVPNSAFNIRPTNVFFDDPLRKFNFQFPIYVKDKQAQSLKSGNSYALMPTEDVGRIASHHVVTEAHPDLVGAEHCGPASGSKLYKIMGFTGQVGGLRKRRRKNSTKRRTRRRLPLLHRRESKASSVGSKGTSRRRL